MSPWSPPEGVRLGRLTPLPLTGPLQWLDRPGLIEVEHRLELVGQPRVKVVAPPPRPRPPKYTPRPPPPPATPRPRHPRHGHFRRHGTQEARVPGQPPPAL